VKYPKIKLSELGKVITGDTPKTDDPENYNGDIPFVTPADLTNQGVKYINETTVKVTEKGIKNGKLLPKNSVLVCCIGSLGKMGIADADLITNQQINSIIFNEEKIFPKYGYYACSLLKPELEKIAPSTTVKIVKKSLFEEMEIPVPPMTVQKNIAAVLDVAQSLIKKRKESIAKLDELVRAKFSQMFGDPINNPKKWEVKKLKNISTKILSGTTPKGGSEVYIEQGITFLRSQNVWKNRLDLDDVVYIDKETHIKMKKSSLEYRDILMTKTGRINTENSSLGRAAIFLGKNDSANINGHVYLIRLQKDIINEFILFILTTNEYREYIRSVCVGGIDKRQINKEHLEEFPIISPPIELQVQFTKLLTHVEKLKSEMRINLNELEDNFQSLFQQAFKGELVIKDEIPML